MQKGEKVLVGLIIFQMELFVVNAVSWFIQPTLSKVGLMVFIIAMILAQHFTLRLMIKNRLWHEANQRQINAWHRVFIKKIQ